MDVWHAEHFVAQVLMLSLGSWRVVAVEMTRRRRAEDMLVGACEARRCSGLSAVVFEAWRDASRLAKKLAGAMKGLGVRWNFVGWAVQEWRRVAVSRREVLRRMGRNLGIIRELAGRTFFHRWCSHWRLARAARRLEGRCRAARRQRMETIGILFFQQLWSMCVYARRVERARRILGRRR